MPLYFFSLTDSVFPKHCGEELPNDAAAKKHAEGVEKELNKNRPLVEPPLRVRVFNAEGKRVA